MTKVYLKFRPQKEIDIFSCTIRELFIAVLRIFFYVRYGVVLKKLDLLTEATEILVEAITKEPLHWGAWMELTLLITGKDMVWSPFIAKSKLMSRDKFVQYRMAKCYVIRQNIYTSMIRQGFRPPSQHHRGGGRGDIPPCWQRKREYIADFAVISAKICHFKHSIFSCEDVYHWKRKLLNNNFQTIFSLYV